MQQNDARLKELLDRISSLPEGSDLPEEILSEYSQEELLAAFVERMIEDKGEVSSDELRAKILDDLNGAISDALVDAMPDYLVKLLNEEFDSGADDDKIQQAIKESGIDVETITEKAVRDFREKYLKGEA
jgi:hypothetical protein